MLTDVLNSFVHAFSLRHSTIYGHANHLLQIFILIELVLFGIYLAFEGGEVLQSLFKKVLLIGVFQFLIFQYAWLVDGLRDSFVGVGLVTGSGPSLTLSEFLDPSALISHGLDVVSPVLEKMSFWSAMAGPGYIALVAFFCTLLILVAFVIVGLQVFLTLVEFYIVTTLAIILIPFGLFRPTAFLADKAFGAIFTSCIKLMVLAFTASIALPIIDGLKFTSDDPTFDETFTLLIGVCAVALVIQRAPAIAIGIVSGSSNLDVGPIVQPMMKAARNAGTVMGAISSGAGAVASMASIGIGGAARAASMSGEASSPTGSSQASSMTGGTSNSSASAATSQASSDSSTR